MAIEETPASSYMKNIQKRSDLIFACLNQSTYYFYLAYIYAFRYYTPRARKKISLLFKLWLKTLLLYI